MNEDKKRCIKCKQIKSLSAFSKDKYRADNLCSHCKQCEKNYKHGHRQEARKINREWHIKNTYGMTLEEYDHMFEKQKGLCATCGRPETRKIMGTVSRLCVDHNHETNKIRGLLCTGCNLLLGRVENNTGIIIKMLGYLNG